ncbi:hypothetical protein OBBRIDRAFT_791536 [Obba rivulosa]|uniref:Transmembrane protein n=1 Tax=Obba rivulosa TaxID=1052685 RepID=A0A8E2DNY9_9APHY|nr:hypothetical protein OBBRIDRAFT_791536 [Obba rivulosa]
MRCYPLYAARALTLFTLVVLCSHSFILVRAETSPSSSVSPASTLPSSSVSPSTSSLSAPVSTGDSKGSSSSAPGSSANSSVPSPSGSPSSSGTGSSAVPPSPSPSSSPVNSSSSLSPTPSSSSSSAASVSLSSASSSSSSSSSPSSLPSSVSSFKPAPSLVTNGHFGPSTTSLTVPATEPIGSPNSQPISSSTPGFSAGAAVSTSATSSDSSKSFFDNKGAIAGTFTVVALLGAGAIAAITMYVMRRRHRLNDEEEEAYFEKLSEPGEYGNNSSFFGGNPSAAEVATSVAPDQAARFGTADSAGSLDDPQVYPMDYPPGTALARAATQRGPYQYTGQFGTGADYGYPAQPPALRAHPFADPINVQRQGVAPPVTYWGNEDVTHAPEEQDMVYTGVAQ